MVHTVEHATPRHKRQHARTSAPIRSKIIVGAARGPRPSQDQSFLGCYRAPSAHRHRFSPWLAARQPYSDARRSGEVQNFSPSYRSMLHARCHPSVLRMGLVTSIARLLWSEQGSLSCISMGLPAGTNAPRIPRKYTSGQAATLRSRAERAILFRCCPGPASSRSLNPRVTPTLKSIASNTCITGNTFFTRLVRKVKQ